MTTVEYTTLESAREYRGVGADDTTLDARIRSLIAPVTEAIDHYCHGRFYGVTETRLFDWQNEKRLVLDYPLLSLTGIQNGTGVALPIEQTFLGPRNSVYFGWIGIPTSSSYSFEPQRTPYPSFEGVIAVTGVWGLMLEPSPIVQAAANAWINYIVTAQDNPGVSSKSIGGYSVGYTGLTEALRMPPAEAKMFLDALKRRRISASGGSPW